MLSFFRLFSSLVHGHCSFSRIAAAGVLASCLLRRFRGPCSRSCMRLAQRSGNQDLPFGPDYSFFNTGSCSYSVLPLSLRLLMSVALFVPPPDACMMQMEGNTGLIQCMVFLVKVGPEIRRSVYSAASNYGLSHEQKSRDYGIAPGASPCSALGLMLQMARYTRDGRDRFC